MVVIATFKPPESPVKLEQGNILAVLDKKNLGTGTLFVSEKTLSWQKDGSEGFSLDYYNVSLHAISRDPSVYDRECIYILTDPHIEFGKTEQRPSDDEGSDVESEPDLSVLILVPERPSDIQDIYEAIKLCQELNPDPADVDDDEDDDNLYADAEEETEDMFTEAESDHIGDNEVNNLAERLQSNSVDIQYNYRNGNEDEDFEDAD